LGFQQRVMHISLNEVPSQNQLAIGGVTHKLIYKLKPFNFINVGQYPLSYSLYFINVGQCPLSYSNKDLHPILSKLLLMEKYQNNKKINNKKIHAASSHILMLVMCFNFLVLNHYKTRG